MGGSGSGLGFLECATGRDGASHYIPQKAYKVSQIRDKRNKRDKEEQSTKIEYYIIFTGKSMTLG
eukprot:1360303-Amorphochlora_amoeboformis.AAC.1